MWMTWQEGSLTGKAYVKHFGMMGPDALTLFDNEFFNMTEDEVLCDTQYTHFPK